jgi:uncharacterized protein (DUF1810 family)
MRRCTGWRTGQCTRQNVHGRRAMRDKGSCDKTPRRPNAIGRPGAETININREDAVWTRTDIISTDSDTRSATAINTALAEIRRGRKISHWMWYIFPQIDGLGVSETAQYYAISGMAEAQAYLSDPTLGEHLVEISRALMELDTSDASEVFGWPDDMKLRSSMTLFLAGPRRRPRVRPGTGQILRRRRRTT